MFYINCTDKNIQNLNTTRETSIPANCPNANAFTLNYNVIQKFYKKVVAQFMYKGRQDANS